MADYDNESSESSSSSGEVEVKKIKQYALGLMRIDSLSSDVSYYTEYTFAFQAKRMTRTGGELDAQCIGIFVPGEKSPSKMVTMNDFGLDLEVDMDTPHEWKGDYLLFNEGQIDVSCVVYLEQNGQVFTRKAALVDQGGKNRILGKVMAFEMDVPIVSVTASKEIIQYHIGGISYHKEIDGPFAIANGAVVNPGLNVGGQPVANIEGEDTYTPGKDTTGILCLRNTWSNGSVKTQYVLTDDKTISSNEDPTVSYIKLYKFENGRAVMDYRQTITVQATTMAQG